MHIGYRYSALVLCLCLSLATAAWGEKAQPPATMNLLRLQNLEHAELDAIGTVNDSVQDAQGFLWFAGISGLARYDGYNVRIYRYDTDQEHSLSHSNINCLLVDSKGFLWVGTRGGLNRYDPVTERFTRYLNHPDQPGSLSDDFILSLLEDRNGDIWIGTQWGGVNRYVAEDDHFERITLPFLPVLASALPGEPSAELSILSMAEDPSHGLWLGFATGLLWLDPISGEYRDYYEIEGDDTSVLGDKVRFLMFDQRDRLWVASENGLSRFDTPNNRFVRYYFESEVQEAYAVNHRAFPALKPMYIEDVFEDEQQRLWISTHDDGLYIFDPENYHYHHHRYLLSDDGGLANQKIRSMYRDRQHNVWFGVFPVGVSMFDPDSAVFERFRHQPSTGRNEQKTISSSLSHDAVLSVIEDEIGNLWVATEDGLNYIDRDEGRVEQYRYDGHSGGLNANAVILVYKDSYGGLWFSTWFQGLTRMSIDPDGKVHYLHYRSDAAPVGGRANTRSNSGLLHPGIWTVYEDRQRDLWVGTFDNGLYRYHRESDTFHLYSVAGQLSGVSKISCFFEDSQNNFWVGTDSGLAQLDRTTGRIHEVVFSNVEVGNISSTEVSAITEDLDGRIWYATLGGGVASFDPKTLDIQVYRSKHGLADDNVAGIVADQQGKLWISTANGISQFDPDTKRFRNYSKQDGLAGNVHNRPAFILTSNGELVFGSTEGLTIFNPSKLRGNPHSPPVVLTQFSLLNRPVVVGGEDQVLSRSITHASNIQLNHLQSVFSFEFAALNYRSPQKNEYAYKLEGFDRAWNEVGTQRTATYTNLDAGHYTFHVKASNNEGVWNNQGTSVNIHILPPWWRTWWAYSIYTLAFGAVVWLIAHTRRQEHLAENERLVNQRLMEVDKIKDAFLANTSHELRTPLNGIIGLSESLIEGATGSLPEATVNNLNMIVSSGKRLAHLVNDILDFSRLREHTLSLNKQKVDVYSLADVVTYMSLPLIGNKKLEVRNCVPQNLPAVFADENRIQQILYNLLGNAIKFTEQGSVTVSAYVSDLPEAKLWLTVTDTGVGIDHGDYDKIFQAFGQIEDGQNASVGAGLGLAVTQQLVTLHGGEVTVASEVGVGSTFEFSLSLFNESSLDVNESTLDQDNGAADELDSEPIRDRSSAITQKGITPSENQNTQEQISQYQSSQYQSIESASEAALSDGEHAHILIVDDEPINRQVLLNLLGTQGFRLSHCDGAHEVLDRYFSVNTTEVSEPKPKVQLENLKQVDLLILDVMMPGLSGYELCKIIRQSFSAEQLPILFLSAKNQPGDLAAGFAAGGNDYLTKPVAKDELFARVKTHISLLEKHRNLEQLVQQRTDKLRLTQVRLAQAEKMASLGTLVSGVGHEIGNPAHFSRVAVHNLNQELTAFKTLLLRLTSDADDEEVINEFNRHFEKMYSSIASAMDGTERINSIVGNLRTFSRSENGSTESVNISKGLQSTLRLVQANYKDDIEFICDIHDDPPMDCILSELNQVFMNLMINACQAMLGAEGVASTEGSGDYSGTIKVCMRITGEHLCLSFRDTGPGMSEAVQNRIFEPFYTTKDDGEGTGLGLAISFGIIERHQGRIEVDSKEGQGTEFRIYLPLS